MCRPAVTVMAVVEEGTPQEVDEVGVVKDTVIGLAVHSIGGKSVKEMSPEVEVVASGRR